MSAFIEICDNIPGKEFELDEWNTSYVGCKCKVDYECSLNDNKICKNYLINNNNYNESSCTCIRNGPFYTQDKKLNANFQDKNWHRLQSSYPIVECNIECLCDEETCSNRVVQLGPQHDLFVFDCGQKGKGVRTNSFIQTGQFVADYLGEVIGLNEAERLVKLRQELNEPNYILFLKEHCSPMDTNAVTNESKSATITTVIDARNYSNIARFINHSCEPNLFVLPVRINNIVPHAALFAIRDIQIGEELSYDYMPTATTTTTRASDEDKEKNLSDIKCLCGSTFCRKFLPAL